MKIVTEWAEAEGEIERSKCRTFLGIAPEEPDD
jgi:hypothetical protein